MIIPTMIYLLATALFAEVLYQQYEADAEADAKDFDLDVISWMIGAVLWPIEAVVLIYTYVFKKPE
jgi:hypothetical protein